MVCVRVLLCTKGSRFRTNTDDNSVQLPLAWFLRMAGNGDCLPRCSCCFFLLTSSHVTPFWLLFLPESDNSLSQSFIASRGCSLTSHPSPSTSACLSPGAVSLHVPDSLVHHLLVGSPLFFLCSFPCTSHALLYPPPPVAS